MCFIIILLLISTLAYNISFYNVLIKDTWCNSPIILIIFLALSLVCLTTSVFINYKDQISMIPLYFLILFFELIIFIVAKSRMFLKSIFISFIIFLLTGLEILFSLKTKNPELCWLISPFFFFSLIQIAIFNNLYINNFDYIDIY